MPSSFCKLVISNVAFVIRVPLCLRKSKITGSLNSKPVGVFVFLDLLRGTSWRCQIMFGPNFPNLPSSIGVGNSTLKEARSERLEARSRSRFLCGLSSERQACREEENGSQRRQAAKSLPRRIQF